MAYTHIGHDSHIGSGCILANSATLAGHVTVEDYAVVGALCPVHQFCRIGTLRLHRRRHHHHAGRAALLAHLHRAQQPRLRPQQGRPRTPRLLPRADQSPPPGYRLLQASKLNTTDALAAIRATLTESSSPTDQEHVAYLADFIANSHRGVIK